MINPLVGLLVGLVVGSLVTGVIIWKVMPRMMLEVKESNFPLEETVSRIEQVATENNWQVPKIYNLKNSLNEAGYKDFSSLKILSMCQPDYAYQILTDDDNKKVSSMMPCRIGVYEDASGRVLISRMNIGLMSKMFGGTIESVMGNVAAEEDRILEEIVKQ